MLSRMALLCALTFSGGLAAQEIPRLAAKPDPRPVDRLMVASNVSVSRPVVGVMYVNRQPAALANLLVRIPEELAGSTVCARLMSDDGMYEGLAEYAVTDESLGAVVSLDLFMSEQHRTKLAGLPDVGLGVAVTKGACAEEGADYLPVVWRGTPERAETGVRVLVNGQGAHEVSVVGLLPDGATSFIQPCEPIPDGARVAFDRECLIDVAALGKGEMAVQVMRMTAGSYDDPIEITIDGPGAAR